MDYKKENPNVPITPYEIAEDVYNCYKAGAAICHIHVRDKDGNGTMDKNVFEETVNLIKEKCDIIINCTTSGDLNATDETRMAHLKTIKPDIASYDCGSMNWMHKSLFINHPKFLEELGNTMLEYGVKPEIEIFDAGMIYNSLYYLKKVYLLLLFIINLYLELLAELLQLLKIWYILKILFQKILHGLHLE